MDVLPACPVSAKVSQPLLALSPERVNGTRPQSTLSMASKSSKTSDADIALPGKEIMSPSSSPTRRANLFADYQPNSSSHNQPISAFPPPGGVPQSPSLPEFTTLRTHVRTNSDVQGLVKRFEYLDVRDRDAENVERRRKHEAELRRAQIAREEAESDVRKLREDLRRSRRDGEEGRERERKVAKRLEVVMVCFAVIQDGGGDTEY